MKKRLFFVSNSSSCSGIYHFKDSYNFAPEAEHDFKRNMNSDNIYTAGVVGEVEFGWEHCKHKDIESKMNWILLQWLYAFGEDRAFHYGKTKEMEDLVSQLVDSINELNGIGVKAIEYQPLIDGLNRDKDLYAYIDHQSVGGYELRILLDTKDCAKFLFDINTYVETDNDNDY